MHTVLPEQVIRELQDAIRKRRTNLQTALANEAQVDGILFWSGVYKYMWAIVFVVVTCVIFYSVITGTPFVVYGLLGAYLLVFGIIFVLGALGVTVGSWDVSEIMSNTTLLLGLPTISF